MFDFIKKYFSGTMNRSQSISITNRALAEWFQDLSDPLSIPAVLRGVTFIADNGSKVPVDVFIKDQYNSREKDKKHQASKVLKRPNSFQTPYKFFNLMFQHAILKGNYYGRIYRDADFSITDIIPLDPDNTKAEIVNGQLVYQVRMDNKVITLMDFEVLHIKGLMANNYTGHSIIELMNNAFTYSAALTTHGTNYFKNGSHLKQVVTMPKEMWSNETKRKGFMDVWKAQHSGTDNSGKDAFICEGMVVDTKAISNNEGQYLEARENDIINVSNILGCPAHFLGSKNATSHNSTIEEKQSFLDFCLDPWLVNIEQELESKLLLNVEREEETRYIEFNRKAFVGMNPELEARILVQYYTNNLMSFEEVRAKINLPTKRDPKQEWLTPLNMGSNLAPVAPVVPVVPVAPAVNEQARSLALATVERLSRRLERSNKEPLSHLEVFEQSLPHLKAECQDILNEANEAWLKGNKKEAITLVRSELCQII